MSEKARNYIRRILRGTFILGVFLLLIVSGRRDVYAANKKIGKTGIKVLQTDAAIKYLDVVKKGELEAGKCAAYKITYFEDSSKNSVKTGTYYVTLKKDYTNVILGAIGSVVNGPMDIVGHFLRKQYEKSAMENANMSFSELVEGNQRALLEKDMIKNVKIKYINDDGKTRTYDPTAENADERLDDFMDSNDYNLRPTGSNEEDLLAKALTNIFRWVFSLFKTVNTTLINWIITDIDTKFRVDPEKNFIPLFYNTKTAKGTNLLDAFQIVGYVVLLISSIFALFIYLVNPESNDNPVMIAVRTALSAAAIYAYRPIMNGINAFFFGASGSTTGGLASLFTPSNDITIRSSTVNKLVDVSTWINTNSASWRNMVNSSSREVGELILTLFTIGASLALLISIIRILLEIMERWILANLYFCIAPVAFSLFPSKNTSDVTITFFKGYFTHCFIMIMNIWFVSIFKIILHNINGTDGISKMNPMGWDNFLYVVFLIGLLQACMRLDNYLSDMGFTVARTGHQLGGAVLAGFGAGIAAISTGVGIARTAVSAPYRAKDWWDRKSFTNQGITELNRHGRAGEGVAQRLNRTMRENNMANATRKNGGVLTKGVLDQFNKNSKNGVKMDYESLRTNSGNLGIKRADNAAAKDLLQGHTSRMAKKTGFRFSGNGNTIDAKNGQGTFSGVNKDGTTVHGGFSEKYVRGSVNMADEGKTPLWFKADPDSAPIGGVYGSGIIKDHQVMSVADYEKSVNFDSSNGNAFPENVANVIGAEQVEQFGNMSAMDQKAFKEGTYLNVGEDGSVEAAKDFHSRPYTSLARYLDTHEGQLSQETLGQIGSAVGDNQLREAGMMNKEQFADFAARTMVTADGEGSISLVNENGRTLASLSQDSNAFGGHQLMMEDPATKEIKPVLDGVNPIYGVGGDYGITGSGKTESAISYFDKNPDMLDSMKAAAQLEGNGQLNELYWELDNKRSGSMDISEKLDGLMVTAYNDGNYSFSKNGQTIGSYHAVEQIGSNNQAHYGAELYGRSGMEPSDIAYQYVKDQYPNADEYSPIKGIQVNDDKSFTVDYKDQENYFVFIPAASKPHLASDLTATREAKMISFKDTQGREEHFYVMKGSKKEKERAKAR